MSVLFLEYPKCSTCKKAKAWLDAQGVSYTDRDIVTDNPTADELRTWYALPRTGVSEEAPRYDRGGSIGTPGYQRHAREAPTAGNRRRGHPRL